MLLSGEQSIIGDIIQHLNTNFIYILKNLQTNKVYVQNLQERTSIRRGLKTTNNFSLITAYKYNANDSHFLKMLYISQSQMGDFHKDFPHGDML